MANEWWNNDEPGDREWGKWAAFLETSWEPPASLEAALHQIQDSRVLLKQAVDIMAFGKEGAPAEPCEKGATRRHTMEVAARRGQAGKALCAAAQKGDLKLMGARTLGGDATDGISPTYFDTPRKLGSVDNSLETDADKIPGDCPIGVRRAHEKWFNVRIETPSLLAWLRGAGPLGGDQSLIEMKDSPGRKAGQGSFAPLDEPLLTEMKGLIENLKAASAEEAARMVAGRAHGGGSVHSKAERLARRYREREK